MQDKVVLITGSTSGIGKVTAQTLLNKGATVIISSQLDLDQAQILSEFTNNEKATYIKCDISLKSDVENAKQQILAKFGKLDMFVANAGIQLPNAGIDKITDEIIDQTLNVNLKGTFWSLKIFGSLVQSTSQNGSIVCLSSVDGLIGEPFAVMYSATKAAIISLTKSFARYFKNPLVRVNAVAPGLIDTPLTSATGEDPSATTDLSVIQRMGTSQEIANTIVFLLSDEASFITGQIIAVDGGFTLK